MNGESYGRSQEVPPIEHAKELAEELWGGQYDEEAMRRDGLNPFFDRDGLDSQKYRRWTTEETDREITVSKDGHDYVWDKTQRGFRRVLTDRSGNRRGLGKLFRDEDGFEAAQPKGYSY